MIQISIIKDQDTLIQIPRDIDADGPFSLVIVNGMSNKSFAWDKLQDTGNSSMYMFTVDASEVTNSGLYDLTLTDNVGMPVCSDIANVEMQDSDDPDFVDPDDFYYEADEVEKFIPGGQGPQGADGVQGPAGPQGVNGHDGLPGPQGADGSQGADGVQGADGAQGEQGLPGPQGADGSQGADGAQGADGPQGADGAQGEQGPQGVNGHDGVDGPQGADGSQGADGAQGEQGPQGADGAQGEQGEPGPQGPQGADGIQGADGESFPAWFGTKEEYDAIQDKDPDLTYYVQGGNAWYGTQEEYDALPYKDPDTMYYIQGGDGTWFGTQGEYEALPYKDPDVIYYVQGEEGGSGAQGPQGADGAQGPQGTAGLMMQADWTESDTSSPAYIQHKPIVPKTKIVYVNGQQDSVTGNIIAQGTNTFVLEDLFWCYNHPGYGPISGIHISFDQGLTYYDILRYGNDQNMAFFWPRYTRWLFEVTQVATTTTNGIIRIISYGLEDEDAADYHTMYRHTNIPNSAQGDILKVVSSTNTDNGWMGIAFHADADGLEVVYKPEAYKDTHNGRAVATIKPQRDKTIGANDNFARNVAFTDEIPAGSFETWTFTVDDGQGGTTTVTKSVFVGS